MMSLWEALQGNETGRASAYARMLTAATIGMLSYAGYSAGWAVYDMITGPHLEWWAELGLVLFALLLALGALFVRARLPGGLAFAIGAMLGLQALAVHTAAHLLTGLTPQIGRGVLAIALVVIAHTTASSPRREQ
jgi:hypothetical protein